MPTLVGGMQTGKDGRIHTTFGHDPSTLRLCSYDPNLQNIPRGGTEVQKWVKDIFEAPEGYMFMEVDYSALEAVLVGYFAGSARYIKAAKLGVHAALVGDMIGEPVDLNDDSPAVRTTLKALKKAHGDTIYPAAKVCVHGGNYLMKPKLMHETYPEHFKTLKAARELQERYFTLFPEIREWQKDLCERVDGTKRWRLQEGEVPDDITPWSLGTAMVQNPFGYLHRFYNVLEWSKAEGEWYSSYGPDSARLVAFLPQSTGSGIVKHAASTLYYDFPDIGRMLRLLVHDSLFLEVPVADVTAVAARVKSVMTAPVSQLPLDPEWGLGEFLSIGVEIKVGKVWSDMNEVVL